MIDGLETPLKSVARDVLTDEYVDYRKEGFGFPIEMRRYSTPNRYRRTSGDD